jgi:hypothetical protein
MSAFDVIRAGLVAGAALVCSSLGASASTCTASNPGNSCSFQGITFTLTPLTTTEIQVEMNVGTLSGDWATDTLVEAFALTPSGGTWTSANTSGFTTVLGGLSNGSSAGGCDTHGAATVCFDSNSATAPVLSGDLKFDVFFTGGTVDFSTTHLKVCFLVASTDTGCTGSLLSDDFNTVGVNGIPGPIAGAGLPGLIAACGGLLLLARRRRSTQQVA